MNCGLLSAVVIAVCLPGHTRALYSPTNGRNMGAPRESAEADAGVENSFAIGHTSNGLTHLYAIDVAISMAGQLVLTVISASKNLKESLERSPRKTMIRRFRI
jgi:hypothetical protein